MKNLISRFLTLLSVMIITACSSEPSDTAAGNKNSDAAEESQPDTRAGLTIGAFLGGAGPDEAAAKAFERGMKIAAELKSPASVNRTILERSQGAPDSPALPPLLAKVPLVVYWQTTDISLAAPVLKQSDVLAVSVWNVTKKTAALGSKVYGFGYSTEKSFAEYAKFAGRSLKSYRFAIISSSAEPFSTQSKAFIEETKSQGNTVVFEEKADSANTDFKALLTRAGKEKCDTVFAVLPGDSLIEFIRAARAVSFAGKILVGDSFFETERSALGKDAEGIYVLQAWSDDADLKTKYSSEFGNVPDGVTLGAAALGYDLIKCIEAAGNNPDSRAISHAWLSTPCQGLTGITQFSGERIAQRVKKILTVKGDKFEPAG